MTLSPPITPVPNFYEFECCRCGQAFIVERDQLNCRIFRCGIIKTSGVQLEPHATRGVCEYYYNNGLLYGCGKPFRIDDNLQVVKCDYI